MWRGAGLILYGSYNTLIFALIALSFSFPVISYRTGSSGSYQELVSQHIFVERSPPTPLRHGGVWVSARLPKGEIGVVVIGH